MFYNYFMKLFTRYINSANNRVDNKKRAEILGYGGRGIQIAPGASVRINKPGGIGTNSFIGLYSYVNGAVTIGDNVWIGPSCSLTAGHHKFDPETGWFSARTNTVEGSHDEIVIGDGTWIASGVIVTAGVSVGKANLICANAVVTKSTPDYAIVAGTPARVMGYIDKDTGEHIWEGKGK
ncbi:MAG: acyltransferase [Clostridia bacterium]